MKKQRGLVFKVVSTFTLIVLITFIIIATILTVMFKQYYFDSRTQFLEKRSTEISKNILYREQGIITQEELENVVRNISEIVEADIVLVDTMGYPYIVTNKEHSNLIKGNFIGDKIDELRKGNSIKEWGIYNDNFITPIDEYIIPVFQNGIFKGAISMYSTNLDVKKVYMEILLPIWIFCILAVIIASIIIYYYTNNNILKPLGYLNDAAKKIAQGDVERRVYIQTNDEISELASSFNFMANSLERVDLNRRDFISNVSHELRTPITSIKGFIGAILDKVIPIDKQDYYLKIAHDETQRLSRLVNELLDLSSVEAGKFSLKLSSVDINAIIKMCVLNLQPKIIGKGIHVTLTFEEEELYVSTDEDRIIQVVTNIIDNAIKYGKDEDGIIKISTKTSDGKAVISVYNNGPKIKEEDVNHIWDRFYKADKSRTSKVSTGLGLSIVRNIITQLGEDIWVENKDTGVTFSFTQKKSS